MRLPMSTKDMRYFIFLFATWFLTDYIDPVGLINVFSLLFDRTYHVLYLSSTAWLWKVLMWTHRTPMATLVSILLVFDRMPNPCVGILSESVTSVFIIKSNANVFSILVWSVIILGLVLNHKFPTLMIYSNWQLGKSAHHFHNLVRMTQRNNW